MVCHGNICRSPMAKAIMIKKLQELGRSDIEVDSAGVSAQHAGEPPDHRTIKNAATHGIDVTSYRARQFRESDFDAFDRIYVMDSANYADISLIADNPDRMNKVNLFLETAHPGSNASVPDPWYGDEAGFEKVYKILDKGCNAIAKQIMNHNKG